MCNRKTLVIGTSFATACLVSAIAEPSVSGNGNMIQCTLELGKQWFVEGQVVALYITMINTSEDFQLLQRPEGGDIEFAVQGPGSDDYALQFNSDVVSIYDREIALRPHCAIRIALGSVSLSGGGEDSVPFPVGVYSISGSWKKESLFRHQGFREIAGCTGSLVEYPLQVRLSPVSSLSCAGAPVIVQVEIANNGTFPVRLLNYFHPYANHFELNVEGKSIGEGSLHGQTKKNTVAESSAVTPNTSDGWIALLPNESLFINIDIGDEVAVPGMYNVSVVYKRSVLLLAPKMKPRYTKQHRWHSDTIEIIRTQDER